MFQNLLRYATTKSMSLNTAFLETELSIISKKCLISTVGFVGLGNMGKRMVENLLNKGEAVMAYDIRSVPFDYLNHKSNVIVTDKLPNIAENCSRVITMLPDNNSVWTVYAGENGIFENYRKETGIFIDCSTTDPRLSQELWKLAREKGITFIDAPVTGGVMGAGAGTLTFMVGGCEAIPQDAEHILLKMGSRIIHCGKSGMGQAAKLCNNMLLGTTMAAVAETMNLGIKYGLDGNVLTSIINSGSGRCWSSEIYHPVPGILNDVPSSRDYEGGFQTNLLVKDLKLALQLAEKVTSSVLLAQTALKMYNEMAVKKGFGNLDFSAIYKYISEKKDD